MTPEQVTLRECSAAMIELCLAMRELLRRIPGNDDLAGRVGYTMARLDSNHRKAFRQIEDQSPPAPVAPAQPGATP